MEVSSHMSVLDDDDEAIFDVVVNDEDQHALWPADLDIPAGWGETGQPGTRTDCARYIERVWPDIRPRSVRPPPRPAART